MGLIILKVVSLCSDAEKHLLSFLEVFLSFFRRRLDAKTLETFSSDFRNASSNALLASRLPTIFWSHVNDRRLSLGRIMHKLVVYRREGVLPNHFLLSI
jgi:hypothetical protein